MRLIAGGNAEIDWELSQSLKERGSSAWSVAKVVPLKRALKAQKFLAAATGGTTGTTRLARSVVGFTPSASGG